MRRATPAVVADVLTISRLGLAVSIIPAVWTSRLTLSCALVSVAWLTDILDGRIARSAGVTGRMGKWDLSADTAVGLGLVIGLTGAGEVPPAFTAVVVIGLGGWFLAGNFAAALLLQLAGYLPFLGIVWTRRPAGWWLPFVTALTIGVIDWRRLVTTNIPRFIRSLTRRGSDEPAGAGSPDDSPA